VPDVVAVVKIPGSASPGGRKLICTTLWLSLLANTKSVVPPVVTPPPVDTSNVSFLPPEISTCVVPDLKAPSAIVGMLTAVPPPLVVPPLEVVPPVDVVPPLVAVAPPAVGDVEAAQAAIRIVAGITRSRWSRRIGSTALITLPLAPSSRRSATGAETSTVGGRH
jgi:hypothetical protein